MNNELNHIIKACLQKEKSAQKALYELYVDRLYFTAIRYINDIYFVENILQDVFLKVFKNLNTFDENKASFTTWINTITIRECLNHLRKKKLEFVNIDESSIQISESIDPILLEMEAEELILLIARIPEKYRIVFNLYELDGYSHSEIADILTITASTSRSYLTRAKKMIQQEIYPVSSKRI